MSKDSSTKLPKTIAGVKIPKALRKVDLVDGLLATLAGREVLARAIAAGAQAAIQVILDADKKPTEKAQSAAPRRPRAVKSTGQGLAAKEPDGVDADASSGATNAGTPATEESPSS